MPEESAVTSPVVATFATIELLLCHMPAAGVAVNVAVSDGQSAAVPDIAISGCNGCVVTTIVDVSVAEPSEITTRKES